MNRLIFYLQYAARNVWRNRRWSAFAMLSVAAGVATVVALRSLGLAIGDSLTSNVRSANHGDITLAKGNVGPVLLNTGQEQTRDVFSTGQIQAVQDWADRQNAEMTAYNFTSLQVTALNSASAGLFNFMTALFIDPAAYPLTEDIIALEPEGVPLGELFQGGAEVVISENLAQTQGIQIGDLVRVSGTEETFTVRGIVPTEAEAGLRDPFAALFGFVYFDRTQQENIPQIDLRPNRISMILPDGTPNPAIEEAADELNNLLIGAPGGGFYRVISVPSLIEENEIIADVTGRFVVVMGLGAMLLGGVGIINTMLVMVRRRTNEIAALKTFGLKGRQVAILFMTEALVLGFLGSLVGMVAGVLLSFVANRYGESFVLQPVQWNLYPEALLFGLVLGMVVTAVFGVMPVLTAIKVRPASILRPNESSLPALGLLQSVGVTLFVVLALGLVAGQIIGPLPSGIPWLSFIPLPPNLALGIVGVAITLLILAVLVGILWLVVWLVGRIPAFGWLDLRMALTNLRAHRLRTATTLLAISVGMFALSSISFYGASVREILQFNLVENFGGNIVVFMPASFTGVDAIIDQAQRTLDEALDEMDGVTYRTVLRNYGGTISSAAGQSLIDNEATQRLRELQEQQRVAQRSGDFRRAGELQDQLEPYLDRWIEVVVRDTDNPDLLGGGLAAGRNLTLEDTGHNVAVLTYEPRFRDLGVGVGSEITVNIRNRDYTFEVIGLRPYSEDGPPPSLFGALELPPQALSDLRPEFILNTLFVEPEQMTDVMLEISAMPGFFPLNVALFDSVLSRFIDQFSALPLLVGLLSLGAAAVIMANTVALATLERRQQIGILKAIGLKSRRVLSIMLLENTMVSLLGALIGIGLSALGVAVLTLLGQADLVLIPDDARPVAIGLVIAAVIIGSTATFLSANVAVRERVLNVLRYE